MAGLAHQAHGNPMQPARCEKTPCNRQKPMDSDGSLRIGHTHQRTRCKAHSRRNGGQCRAFAVNGKDVCRMHGGVGSGRPIITGEFSKRSLPGLVARAERHRQDPSLLALKTHIALKTAIQERLAWRVDEAEAELQEVQEAGRNGKKLCKAEDKLLALYAKVMKVTDQTERGIVRWHRVTDGGRVTITLDHIEQALKVVDGLIKRFVDAQDQSACKDFLRSGLRLITVPVGPGGGRN